MRARSLTPLLVGLALAAVFGATAASTVQEADSGEFAALALARGMAHPPGYPLFSALVRALGSIDITLPIPWRISLMNAFFGAAAGGVATAALLAVRFGVATTVFSVGLCFLSLPVWRVATGQEPFALNLLVGAALLWCAAVALFAAETPGKDPPPKFLGLVLGMSVGIVLLNHHTGFLYFPLSAAAAWGTWRAGGWRAAGKCGLLALVGIGAVAPFATWYAMPPSHGAFVWPSWPDVPGWSDAIRHFLRLEYGTFRLAADATVTPGDALSYFTSSVFGWLSHGGAELATCGALFTFVPLRGASAASRFTRYAVVSFAMVLLCFGLLFNIDAGDSGRGILVRFMAQPVLLLIPPIALGVDRIARLFPQLCRGKWALAMTTSLLAAHAAAQYQGAERRSQIWIEAYLGDVMRAVDQEAVIFANTDFDIGGLKFKTLADREAKHAVVLSRGDWRRPNGRARVLRELEIPGYEIRDEGDAGLNALLRAVSVVRPVYVFDLYVNEDPTNTLQGYPVGPVIRLTRPGETPPSGCALLRKNLEIFLASRCCEGAQGPGSASLAATMRSRYARSIYMPLLTAGLDDISAPEVFQTCGLRIDDATALAVRDLERGSRIDTEGNREINSTP